MKLKSEVYAQHFILFIQSFILLLGSNIIKKYDKKCRKKENTYINLGSCKKIHFSMRTTIYATEQCYTENMINVQIYCFSLSKNSHI